MIWKFDAGISRNVPALPISQNFAVHDLELQSSLLVHGNPKEQRKRHEDPHDNATVLNIGHYLRCMYLDPLCPLKRREIVI